MGQEQGSLALPGRSLWLVLALESERDRQGHGQRQDLSRETVRLSVLCPPKNLTLEISYNDELSLEDAIHTALLTLKESFEGVMTEKTIELGVIELAEFSASDLTLGGFGTGLKGTPGFRKLTEEEVKDYLLL